MELSRSTQRRWCGQQAVVPQSVDSQCYASRVPGEVLELVLAHLPFRERVKAAEVCHAWRQHLSQPGLPVWQAASIVNRKPRRVGNVDHLPEFVSLQHWLLRHGSGLLHVHCSAPLRRGVPPGDGLLAAFLTTVGCVAPSLQAVRLDGEAAGSLTSISLVGIASMGRSLRQLALIGVQQVPVRHLAPVLDQLPMLQDLAIMFAGTSDARDAPDSTNAMPRRPQPDFLLLLTCLAADCTGLQTLALGVLPHENSTWPGAEMQQTGRSWPQEMSRLKYLHSLTLQNVDWEYIPHGLPELPQLRQLSLRGNSSWASSTWLDFKHQLSTLTTLETLQASLPMAPGRLPCGLTQLVLSPFKGGRNGCLRRGKGYEIFCRHDLPALRGLRHLAFHGLLEFGEKAPYLCLAAGALPHLISLHLVNCDMCILPKDLSALSHVQLLNLSDNSTLWQDGCSTLARAPLHQLTSCKQLDLRFTRQPRHLYTSLQPDAVRAVAGMPALEQLAYSLAPAAVQTQLAACRAPGLPPISVIVQMPDSDTWAAVSTELPFGEVNDMLGVQLDRRIGRAGILVNPVE